MNCCELGKWSLVTVTTTLNNLDIKSALGGHQFLCTLPLFLAMHFLIQTIIHSQLYRYIYSYVCEYVSVDIYMHDNKLCHDENCDLKPHMFE